MAWTTPDRLIADLKPDILESEVKWDLESMANHKDSGCDGMPLELFKILKDEAIIYSTGLPVWKNQQ